MSKAMLVVCVGVIVAFLPFTGLPFTAKTWIAVGAGAALIVLGLLMRVERLWMLRALGGGRVTDAYAENAPQPQVPHGSDA